MNLYCRIYCPICKTHTLFTFPCKQPDFGMCKKCEYVWSKEEDSGGKNVNPIPLHNLLGIEQVVIER